MHVHRTEATAFATRRPLSGSGDEHTSPALGDPAQRPHLERFRQGGSFLAPASLVADCGWFARLPPALRIPAASSPRQAPRSPARGWGRRDGLFMTPRRAMDEVIRLARGSIAKLNQLLGTYFDDVDGLYRIDVLSPLRHNARIASGGESGANRRFLPGGFTSGGIPEVVTDPIHCPQAVQVSPLCRARPPGIRHALDAAEMATSALLAQVPPHARGARFPQSILSTSARTPRGSSVN